MEDELEQDPGPEKQPATMSAWASLLTCWRTPKYTAMGSAPPKTRLGRCSRTEGRKDGTPPPGRRRSRGGSRTRQLRFHGQEATAVV